MPDELPRAEVGLLGETGSRRIDALVHDLVETSQREGDIRQSEEIGTAMLALRTFMFERVYLGPHTEAQHERAREVVARVFAHLADHPNQAPETPGDPAADRRLRCRHDRSLRPRLRGPAVVPRFTEDSKQRVIAAADMVDVVSGRTQRPQGRLPPRAAVPSTRSGRRASPSTPSTSSTTASAAPAAT